MNTWINRLEYSTQKPPEIPRYTFMFKEEKQSKTEIRGFSMVRNMKKIEGNIYDAQK